MRLWIGDRVILSQKYESICVNTRMFLNPLAVYKLLAKFSSFEMIVTRTRIFWCIRFVVFYKDVSHNLFSYNFERHTKIRILYTDIAYSTSVSWSAFKSCEISQESCVSGVLETLTWPMANNVLYIFRPTKSIFELTIYWAIF